MSEWISVKERLPEVYEKVLVLYLPMAGLDGEPIVAVDMLVPDGDCGHPEFYTQLGGRKVAYWMPLPELPEGVREFAPPDGGN